ncbi:MAG: TonB-dependent receptor [Marinomonas sp.]
MPKHINTQKTLISLAVGTALMSMLSSTALAEDTTKLDTLEITATAEEGVNTEDSTATKMNISLKDTTRSVVQVSEEEISDMSAQDIEDIAAYQTGFDWVESSGRYIQNRGIQTTLSSFTVNGLRTLSSNGSNGSSALPSTYNLESVTFLNGADSLLYGSGIASGTINATTKKPQEESETTLGLSTRSYAADDVGYFDRNQVNVDLDSTGKLVGDDVLYRVITRVTPDGESHQDGHGDDDKFIDASLTFKIGDRTKITPRFEYKDQEDTGGSPWTEGQFTESWYDGTLDETGYMGAIPDRSLSIGSPLDYATQKTTTAQVDFEHLLENDWSINAKMALVSEETYTQSLYASTGITGNSTVGATTLERKWVLSQSDKDSLLFDVNTEGKLTLGNTEHHLLAGVNYIDKTINSGTYYQDSTESIGLNTINLYDVDSQLYQAPTATHLAGLASKIGETYEREYNFYLKDRVTINKWTLGLGLGYLDFYGEETDGQYKQGQQHLSYDAALLYKLNQDMNLFASYSQTYDPVSTKTVAEYGEDGVDYVPEESDNYELGIKGSFLNGRLNASANLFYINTKNVTETVDSDDDGETDSIEQTLGEKFRSHGIDISALYHFTDQFSTQINYTYTDAHDTTGDEEGVQSNYTPYHQLTIWNSYSLAEQPIRFALGMRSASSSQDDTSNADTGYYYFPGYAEFDAGAYYETEKWDASLTITNLLDKNRTSSLASGYTFTASAPRAINFGIKYRL